MGFLTGKTAIITGGSRATLADGSCGSIGYGIATAYAKEGCNLVLTGRNMKKLTDAKEELESKYGIKVLAVQADVSEGQDNKAVVENVVKQAVDTFGGIDVLINNAQASASGAGLFGNFGQCSYAAAKEGIRGLTRVAATEWGKDGINVNIVCPLAWTAQLEQFEKAYPEAFKANVKMPPMGHYADPETEIGRGCVALAHPDFKYMSGETLTFEGGMGLRP